MQASMHIWNLTASILLELLLVPLLTSNLYEVSSCLPFPVTKFIEKLVKIHLIEVNIHIHHNLGACQNIGQTQK